MSELGFFIFLSVVLYIDFQCYKRGQDNTIFFKDKTNLEKNLREIQKIEAEIKTIKLRRKLKKIEQETFKTNI